MFSVVAHLMCTCVTSYIMLSYAVALTCQILSTVQKFIFFMIYDCTQNKLIQKSCFIHKLKIKKKSKSICSRPYSRSKQINLLFEGLASAQQDI